MHSTHVSRKSCPRRTRDRTQISLTRGSPGDHFLWILFTSDMDRPTTYLRRAGAGNMHGERGGQGGAVEAGALTLAGS